MKTGAGRRPRRSDIQCEEWRMKSDKQKHNWLLDAALFGGFLVALWLDLTGVAVHQWLGVAVGLIAGYHLWKHWRWVKAVTGRLFGRTSRQSRTYYAVDAGLAVGLAAISVTGLVHLDLARSPAGELCGLAGCACNRLGCDSGAGGRQDRAALAVDSQRGAAQRLSDAGSPGGRGAAGAGRGPGGAARLRAADGGCGRGGAVGRLQCIEGSGG